MKMKEEKNNQSEIPEEEVQEEQETIDEEQTLKEIEQLSIEEIAAMKKELIEYRAKSEEYLDGWQRARAEFSNYRKRIEKERSVVYQTTSGNIIKRFLDVLDDLELALNDRPESEGVEDWAAGIELIYRKFTGILEVEGVKAMELEGQYFDPNLHEAMSSEDNDEYESGQIIEVVKRGYWIGEKVLRPSLVRVAE